MYLQQRYRRSLLFQVHDMAPFRHRTAFSSAVPSRQGFWNTRAILHRLFFVSCLRFKKCADKFFLSEDLQILYFLAKTYITNRNTHCMAYTDYNSAFGCAVKFGNDKPGHFCSSCKLFACSKAFCPVLPSRTSSTSSGVSGTTLDMTLRIL